MSDAVRAACRAAPPPPPSGHAKQSRAAGGCSEVTGRRDRHERRRVQGKAFEGNRRLRCGGGGAGSGASSPPPPPPPAPCGQRLYRRSGGAAFTGTAGRCSSVLPPGLGLYGWFTPRCSAATWSSALSCANHSNCTAAHDAWAVARAVECRWGQGRREGLLPVPVPVPLDRNRSCGADRRPADVVVGMREAFSGAAAVARGGRGHDSVALPA